LASENLRFDEPNIEFLDSALCDVSLSGLYLPGPGILLFSLKFESRFDFELNGASTVFNLFLLPY